MNWLAQAWTALTLREALIGVLIFIITFSISLAMVSFLVVRLPVNYFQASHDREFLVNHHPAIRWIGVIAKNAIGALMIILGIAMSLPGVPGQGILTILLGVMLMDFPGKRHLEYKLISRPKVFGAINRLRNKFGKPPLILD